jgi:transposase
LIKPYTPAIEAQMQELYNRLPEKNRRLYAGIEALKLPYGGVSYIARLFNCARDTVLRGIQELNEEETLPQNRSRRAGGGRKAILKQESNIDEIFLLLLKEHTAGDPMDEKVKWTDLTCADISVLLAEQGIKVSRNIVRKLLKKHGHVKRKVLKKSLPETTEIVMLNLNESAN